MSRVIRTKEVLVEKVIMLEKTYYMMNGNQFTTTKKLKYRNIQTTEIVEVHNYEELSMMLEAQNNRTIDDVILQKNILKQMSN